jgi:DNA-3-methyladenine glycosylase II
MCTAGLAARPKSTAGSKALRHLSLGDARLAKIIKAVGKYDIKTRANPFQSLAEAIIYQQLAGRAADAIYRRFVAIYGRFPKPEQLLATDSRKLKAAGLSTRKIEYLKDLAARVSDGRLKLNHLKEMPDEQVVEQLIEVKGIGRWTAGMFLIFCLGRPDVLPTGDLGLRRAMQIAYGLDELPSPAVMQNIAQCWKPYCSVATWYLWRSLDQFKGR